MFFIPVEKKVHTTENITFVALATVFALVFAIVLAVFAVPVLAVFALAFAFLLPGLKLDLSLLPWRDGAWLAILALIFAIVFALVLAIVLALGLRAAGYALALNLSFYEHTENM